VDILAEPICVAALSITGRFQAAVTDRVELGRAAAGKLGAWRRRGEAGTTQLRGHAENAEMQFIKQRCEESR